MGSEMLRDLNLAVYALAYRDYVVGETVEPLAHRHADPARYLGDRIESLRPRGRGWSRRPERRWRPIRRLRWRRLQCHRASRPQQERGRSDDFCGGGGPATPRA